MHMQVAPKEVLHARNSLTGDKMSLVQWHSNSFTIHDTLRMYAISYPALFMQV
jgi:hypothetical protein